MSLHTHLLAPRDEALTKLQHDTLVLLERAGGSVSLVAVVLIFAAYAASPRVRNVQNTFIVFASISNIGASVASLIALDGVGAGVDSPLCQGQGFLFQMFMQSDPWWSLAMAFNVFLVFFFRTSPDAFRKWWWLYCLICYGGPFVIALTLLLVRNPGKGRMYGSATIWCWVDGEWENVRIFSYYMLIWICIVGSLMFYFMVGYHVFQSRNRLKSISASKSRDGGGGSGVGGSNSSGGGTNEQKPRVDFLVPQDCFYGRIVTEVQVVQSTASSSALAPPAEPKTAYKPATKNSSPSVSFEMPTSCMPVTADPSNSQPYFSNFSTITSAPAPNPRRRRRSRSGRPFRSLARSVSRVANKFVVEDPIKRAYLRTSLLFALSVLATWIPSSMNRIHSWLMGGSPFAYHVATAAVLPLQGLWNAVIFFITSSRGLRETWRCRHDETGVAILGQQQQQQQQQQMGGGQQQLTGRDGDDDVDGESTGMTGRSFMDDDSESGSHVELRRMAEAPGKTSPSL